MATNSNTYQPATSSGAKRESGYSEDMPTLAEQVEVLKKDVAKLASAAGVAARHQIDPIEQYVEREPLKAVMIAAGLGCVLGWLFSRR